MLMKLDDENAAMSVSHTRFLLEQIEEKRSSLYGNRLLNLLLNQRHWSTELMIESLWWSLGNSINDTNNLKKSHSPGSPFFLGLSLVKLSSYASVTKLEMSIHTLRTEYSMSLAEFIVKSVNCIKQYGGLNSTESDVGKRVSRVQSAGTNSISGGLLISARIKDITAYFINHHQACLLLSFSDISLSRKQQVSSFKFEDFQMAIMRSMNSSSLCLNDFTDIFASCKTIRIEHEKNENKVSVYIPSNTEVMWNANLHMHILTLARDMSDLRTELALPQHVAEVKTPHIKKKWIIELSAELSTVFEIKLSERHTMQWFVENLFFSHKEANFISAENLFIKIDDQHIFTLKEIDVQSLPRLDMLTQERVNCEGFVLPTNKVWVTTIGAFKVSLW